MAKYAFISYVRDDEEEILKICSILRGHGIDYWLDKEQRHPGDIRTMAIQKVIDSSGCFLAFFSSNSEAVEKSTLREDIVSAYEISQKSQGNSHWILPVKLTECKIPDCKMYSDLNLQDIPCLELYGEFDKNILKLLQFLGGGDLHLKQYSAAADQRVKGMLHDLNNFLSTLMGYNALMYNDIDIGETGKTRSYLEAQRRTISELAEWGENLKKIIDNKLYDFEAGKAK